MRRILLVVAILIAVVIVGVLIFASTFDVNKYRPTIQAELQKKLNRPVTLGELHLRLFPFSVKVDGLTIGEGAGFPSTQPFAKASEVYVSVGLFSLLSGNPTVKSVELTKPDIEVIRDAKGVWNFSNIGSQQPQQATKSSGSDSSGGGLTLDKLKADDGKVAFTDQLTSQPRSVYDHIDAELTDFAPRKPFHVDLSVHLPGAGAQQIKLDAKVGPIEGVEASAIPVNGHFRFEQVTLSGLTRFAAGALPPNTDSTVSGDGSLESANETVSLKGKLKLENTTVHAVKIDYPVTLDCDLSDNRKTDLITIRSGNVKLGSTPLSLTGTYDAGKKPAQLDMKVAARNAAIAELARLAGAFGTAVNPNYKFAGELNADVTARGAANNPELSGTASLKKVEASGGDLKQPVSVPEIDLTLSPASIVSNPFEARSGSTRVTGAFTLSQYTGANPLADATLKTDNADVANLLDMAKAYGVDAAQGVTGTGKLSLNAHVQGPIRDTAKLNYSGSGNLTGVQLTSSSFPKPIAIQSAALRFAQSGVSVDNLAASLGSSDVKGNVSVQNLAAPQVQFALASNKIDVNELQRFQTNSPAPASAGKTQQAPAQKPQNAHEPSLLSKTTGGGTLSANQILAQELVLSNVKATARLDHGLISLSPVSASVFGGTENGTLSLDTRPAVTSCAVKTKLAGIDTNKLLSAVSSVKNRLYGALGADANLTFALASSADLAKTLNGTLNFNVDNGKIVGVNILNELSKVGKFLGAASANQNDPTTAVKKLAGAMVIQNGVANTDNLVAQLNEGSLSGKGSLNLVSEAINMHVTAVLSSGISNSVGGQKVGGFLNTALANNKGELVLPVIVTGSMQHPLFAPDPQAIAEMKLKNLLPTSGNPASLTTGIVGSVLGKNAGGVGSILGGAQKQQQNGQANRQQQEPADVINNVLGQFGKKKQK